MIIMLIQLLIIIKFLKVNSCYKNLFETEKSKAIENNRVKDLKDKLEQAIATLQEAEDKLIKAETTISEFMSKLSVENVSTFAQEINNFFFFLLSKSALIFTCILIFQLKIFLLVVLR